MRVLFWSGNFWPQIGGAEVLAINLLPALQERGHEFAVMTSQRQSDVAQESHFKDIPVYRFPLRGTFENVDELCLRYSSMGCSLPFSLFLTGVGR